MDRQDASLDTYKAETSPSETTLQANSQKPHQSPDELRSLSEDQKNAPQGRAAAPAANRADPALPTEDKRNGRTPTPTHTNRRGRTPPPPAQPQAKQYRKYEEDLLAMNQNKNELVPPLTETCGWFSNEVEIPNRWYSGWPTSQGPPWQPILRRDEEEKFVVIEVD